ncbi:hypothetical protein GKG47_10825 [Lactonifactor sp. BIOML-A3]|uniref:hypothetical protein n=1 Tax=Clostridiaceae TaxID=31979 RepID=UPI0012AF488B|nr:MULTISPECIES: hypothetical protein [Clostridiaceae]MSA01995.1 hypothetical protein [Lactonifactor sp. BIOML-A5]MSA08509.1 hypothetical protein [Lactonifactor sp. BIOML-A4]MSA12922.1 hypothetical protein [Lactonifactor sp. BIOML-A3]MSA17576.1 hypothetical protein [Lactonifactor sp. BIOML-A2]MSA37108.1 hypothetical protein [Lactonifactor sp. BIOML-A1]
MFSIILIIVLISVISFVAVTVYYVLYSRHINARIASGEIKGKRMIDIPNVIRTVIILALLIYAVITTLALTAGRKQVIEENYDTFSVINLSNYTYSSYKGTLLDKDASYAKKYSRESNDGYQKSVSQDGDFVFTSFTRVGERDAFHPDFFCFVDYIGENSEELCLYESYAFIDTFSQERASEIGSGGGSIQDGFLVIGNVNDEESFKIDLSILDSHGEEAYFEADRKAYEEDKGNFPDASEYALSTSTVVITVQ